MVSPIDYGVLDLIMVSLIDYGVPIDYDVPDNRIRLTVELLRVIYPAFLKT